MKQMVKYNCQWACLQMSPVQSSEDNGNYWCKLQQDSVNHMNRVLISQMEQLKCNFCTQWFSVPAQFASLQKYSLNACQNCMNNFKYRLVDPTTYQLYDVVLIKTGIQLTNKQHQLATRFQAYIKSHADYKTLSQPQIQLLLEQDTKNTDLKAQLNMYIQPIKQRVSEVCRKLLDGLIKNWNSILSDLHHGNHRFDEQKENIIKIISDRWYDFGTDKAAVLDPARIDNVAKMLKDVLDQTRSIRAEDMIGKIKNFVGDFFGINLHDGNQKYSKQTEDKQNKTPNSKRNLRNIREKLMRTSRNFDNELKVGNSNIKSNIKSSKKNWNKSSKKNLLVEPLNLKKQSLQKATTITIKTPRSHRPQPCPQPQLPCSDLDQLRQKMSKLLKQPSEQISYMPSQPQKVESMLNKTYGEKCLLQYMIELKLKTSINDNICQLINENLSKGNMMCYLKSLDHEWKNSISLIRFVKVNMHDYEFDTFLNWFKDKPFVHILVVTNNFFTQLSVEALFGFCSRYRQLGLKQVYMGNNYIKPSKAKRSIQGLRSLGIQVYI